MKQADLLQLFKIFCNTLGAPMATREHPTGLYIDHYSPGGGGGYRIENVTASGGSSTPFGERRYTLKEFAAVLHFGIDVAEYKRGVYGKHFESNRRRR